MPTVPNTSVHEENATAMLVQLRVLVQAVPGFGYLSKAQRRSITPAATVPDVFLLSTGVACDASPTLATSSGLTGVETREVVVFTRAYLSVADELELLAKGLRDTVAQVRAPVGQRSLRAYFNAQRINNPSERALLIPHLANMKRDLGRTHPKPQPDVPVVVTPVPPPVPPVKS
jgi:hypothetical protein